MTTERGSKVCVVLAVESAARPSSRGRTRKALALAPCMVLAAALASCVSLGSAARDEFARTESCPPDLVSVRRRPDVLPHVLRGFGSGADQPLPDVASDPVRLRYWQAHHADRVRQLDDKWDVYEADGCGVQLFLCCARENSEMGSSATCTQGCW